MKIDAFFTICSEGIKAKLIELESESDIFFLHFGQNIYQNYKNSDKLKLRDFCRVEGTQTFSESCLYFQTIFRHVFNFVPFLHPILLCGGLVPACLLRPFLGSFLSRYSCKSSVSVIFYKQTHILGEDILFICHRFVNCKNKCWKRTNVNPEISNFQALMIK